MPLQFVVAFMKKQEINPIHLGPLEQKITQIFWKNVCMDIKSVQELLQKNGVQLAYTTIMTVMNRLVDKKILKKELRGKQYCYSAIKDKKSFVKDLVNQTINNFVNRFGDEAIVAFISETEKLSPNQRKGLISKLIKR